MSGKDTAFSKKRSRRQTTETVRAAIENENEDYKRFPYFLRRACEEFHIPFLAEVNNYLMRDDGENIQVERPLDVPPAYADEQKKKPKIDAYSDMDLVLKKVICRAPLMNSKLFSALIKTLTNFKKLVTIRLDYCDVTSNDIQLLAEYLQETKVIRELSLKGSPNRKQNFYLLIGCGLKYLNLKFCGVDENGLRMIADEFVKCTPSCSLAYLDLSSNMVFDEGCKYVANILRCNRSLRFLSLADCKIGNDGFEQIINSFQKFPLCDEELFVRRKLRMEYYKLLQKEKDGFPMDKKNVFSAGEHDHCKDALTIVEEKLRKHPFTADCIQEDADLLCKGNNKLQSLNVSFVNNDGHPIVENGQILLQAINVNHLTKSSFALTLKVLMEQASMFGSEKGLNRVLLDGNSDESDTETILNAIDEILMGKKIRNSITPSQYSQYSGSAKTRPSLKRRKSSANSSAKDNAL